MDYSFPVFLSVLGAAALHATWNALVRAGGNPLLHTAALVIWTGIIGLPVAVMLPLPNSDSWGLLGLSIVIHVVYFVTLARAYQHGALSVMYPIMRGCAPLLVSVGSLVFIGEPLSVNGWIAVVLISTGVLAIALRSRLANPRRAVSWALACSLSIACYSIVDGQGARLSQSPLSFTAWLFILESLVFTTLLIFAGQGKPLIQYMRQRPQACALGGLLSAVGYAIVLWAMSQAPMALVSATRETSVLFATLIGVGFLKEQLSARQWLGAVIIVCGLIALRL